MEYKIYPSEEGEYIILKVQGEINRKLAMQQNKEAHDLGAKLNINRYLVDVTEAKNTDTISNSYEFAYKDMQHAEGINKKARVALLVSPEDHSHDFIETVAQNAGLNVTKFNDIKLAIAFLK